MMAELRFWLCLFILACVRIRHTHGWFWFDDSKEIEKGVQTPAYLTTVGPTSLPRIETSRTTEESGVSLLQLIGDPPPNGISKVFDQANSPGYVFGPSSNVGQSAAAHLPNPFYRDFSLIFNIKPTSTKPGVIFSITDPTQNIMYVGVKLSAVERGKQSIIFYYTEPDSQSSYQAAKFSVSSMLNIWTRFSISVLNEQVSLYFNCDSDPQVVDFERSPDDMDMDAGAGVFVGHASGADPDKFLGVIGDLRVSRDPGAAERHCEEEEDDFDANQASGDYGASGDGEQPSPVQPTPPSSRPIQQPPVTSRQPIEKQPTGAREERRVTEERRVLKVTGVLQGQRVMWGLVQCLVEDQRERRASQERKE